jgi:hypothetical protein
VALFEETTAGALLGGAVTVTVGLAAPPALLQAASSTRAGAAPSATRRAAANMINLGIVRGAGNWVSQANRASREHTAGGDSMTAVQGKRAA